MTRNQKIIEMVRAGIPYPEIAARYGVSKSRIGQIAKAAGSACRQMFPLPPAPDPALLQTYYTAGCSDQEISRRLNCSLDRVRTWRIKKGLPTHVPRFDPDAVKKAAMMVELGATYAVAAKAFGVTRGAVAGHLDLARQNNTASRRAAEWAERETERSN